MQFCKKLKFLDSVVDFSQNSALNIVVHELSVDQEGALKNRGPSF
jgi:hypothetical protein